MQARYNPRCYVIAIENVNGIQSVMQLMLTDAHDEFLCEYLRAYREF